MGRRQGRATRFRIGDAAAVVSAVPPDALHRLCFGSAAGGGAVRDVLGGADALRLLAADPGLPEVPLAQASDEMDFRLPDALSGDVLLAAVEVLARSEHLAAADAAAARDVAIAPAGERPHLHVHVNVSQRSLGELVRTRLDLPRWWTLPHARISFVNQPDAASWRARIACPDDARLAELAREAVRAFDGALDGEGLLEQTAGARPGGLSTYAIPPHGVLTRIEFARVKGAYWLRSAAALLAAQALRALLDLPGGMASPGPAGPWAWTGSFASRAGTGAGLARLGTWGRPPVSLLEIEGPFDPGRAVAVSLTPRAFGEDAAQAFRAAVAGGAS